MVPDTPVDKSAFGYNQVNFNSEVFYWYENSSSYCFNCKAYSRITVKHIIGWSLYKKQALITWWFIVELAVSLVVFKEQYKAFISSYKQLPFVQQLGKFQNLNNLLLKGLTGITWLFAPPNSQFHHAVYCLTIISWTTKKKKRHFLEPTCFTLLPMLSIRKQASFVAVNLFRKWIFVLGPIITVCKYCS